MRVSNRIQGVIRGTAVVLAGVMLAGCAARSKVSKEIGRRVRAGDEEIEIAKCTKFAWDHLYIFAPYTASAHIDEALGFDWKGYPYSRIEMSDTVCLLIFEKGDTVVHWFDHPRGEGDFAGLAKEGGYTKAEARFTVERGEDGFPRLRVIVGSE